MREGFVSVSAGTPVNGPTIDRCEQDLAIGSRHADDPSADFEHLVTFVATGSFLALSAPSLCGSLLFVCAAR